ncbi:MAG TPA: LCP family protein, partial [Thermomicrobiales bacterium]|nr:LCP family protein [Thermomicrobiales bacterium]
MTSLDRLPLLLSRRRFLAAAAGSLVASSLVTFNVAAQSDGPWTFLALGLDWLDEAPSQRSDIIMLARVDPVANTVRTLSIPRDLYVEIPGHGWDKINAAYQVGLAGSTPDDWDAGATHAARTIALAFGVSIDAYAVTDMETFTGLIDTLGGITVENPYDLTDEYWPADMVLPAGPLELDGETALMYVRARSQDGDGGRVMRQHLVLEAVLAKLQSAEFLPNLPQLVETFQGQVQTSIPLTTQLNLMGMLPELSSANMVFTNIESQLTQGYTEGGAWIYEADWTTLPAYVQAWL